MDDEIPFLHDEHGHDWNHPSEPKTTSTESEVSIGGAFDADLLDASLERKAFSAAVDDEVTRLQAELISKDQACRKLQAFQDRVSQDVQELTAALFEEATRMVNDEKAKRYAAEKALADAKLKLDGLLTEKALRRSMTMENFQPMQPSINANANRFDASFHSSWSSHTDNAQSVADKLMNWLTSRAAVLAPSPTCSPQTGSDNSPEKEPNHQSRKIIEIDPIAHREFVTWRANPTLDEDDPFIQRLYKQDIFPVFEFENPELAAQTLRAVQSNSISIEECSKYQPFSRVCCLVNGPRLCNYRMKLGEAESWYPICAFARNRITSVCDLISYIRYLQQGIVHRGVHDTWLEITRHRERIALARLGLL